jgi:hypothetical protein
MVFLLVYSFPLGSGFFLWVYVYVFFSLSLRLCFSFKVCVYVFPLGLWYSYVLSGLRIRLYGRGEVCFAQRAREELWRENPFPTTTATQLGRGLSYGGCTEIQG